MCQFRSGDRMSVTVNGVQVRMVRGEAETHEVVAFFDRAASLTVGPIRLRIEVEPGSLAPGEWVAVSYYGREARAIVTGLRTDPREWTALPRDDVELTLASPWKASA